MVWGEVLLGGWEIDKIIVVRVWDEDCEYVEEGREWGGGMVGGERVK